MTPEEFAARMEDCGKGDPEGDHSRADDLMCELLESLGYQDGVKLFRNMEKWYA